MKKSTLLIISFALIIIIIALFNFKFNIKEKFIITYKNAIMPTQGPTTPPPTIETQPTGNSSTIVLLNTKKEMDPVDLDPDRVCDEKKKLCLVNYKFTFDNQLKYDYNTYFITQEP